MRRKKTLPTPQQVENMSGNSHDVNGRQIHRLEQDPSLQTLTPRTLAKSMAELEDLRSRVSELEHQLAKHQIEALTPSKSKLPPLADAIAGQHSEITPPSGGLNASVKTGVAKSTCELKTVSDFDAIPSSARIGTAPVTTSRMLNAGSLGSPVRNFVKADGRTLAFASNDDIKQGDEESTLSGEDDHVSPSAVSPHLDETKIFIGQEGEEASFAISKRNRLYQILKHLNTIATIPEDELVLLKKLVDAEIGDVINFLLEIEDEQSVDVIRNKLAALLKEGSPSKHHSLVRPALPTNNPVWGIHYPLLKVAQNLEQLRGDDSDSKAIPSSPSKTDVIVLVSSGAYNPIHMLHIRAFYVARQYVESNYKFPVVGAFISPSHDTFVRIKNRGNPREMITKRHRLALIEAAVASSSWIEVDKWEITRRRVLDYLSTLTHVREMCDSHFPQYRFHVMYVCGCNTVVKLSHSALRDEGFGCITVCRPTQTDMVIKHLGKTLAKATTIVEDTGVLPCDLECATSFRVRQSLTKIEANASKVEMMIGKPAFHYFMKHEIGAKITGKVSWTDEDKQWRQEDLAYVEYIES